jgi:hypothetical protein
MLLPAEARPGFSLSAASPGMASGEAAAWRNPRGSLLPSRSCRVALAESLLPSRSCRVALAKSLLPWTRSSFGQPAATAVADRAPNRNRPSDAPPITTHRLYAMRHAEPRGRQRLPCRRPRDMEATLIGKGELSTGGELPQQAESGEIRALDRGLRAAESAGGFGDAAGVGDRYQRSQHADIKAEKVHGVVPRAQWARACRDIHACKRRANARFAVHKVCAPERPQSLLRQCAGYVQPQRQTSCARIRIPKRAFAFLPLPRTSIDIVAFARLTANKRG